MDKLDKRTTSDKTDHDRNLFMAHIISSRVLKKTFVSVPTTCCNAKLKNVRDETLGKLSVPVTKIPDEMLSMNFLSWH